MSEADTKDVVLSQELRVRGGLPDDSSPCLALGCLVCALTDSCCPLACDCQLLGCLSGCLCFEGLCLWCMAPQRLICGCCGLKDRCSCDCLDGVFEEGGACGCCCIGPRVFRRAAACTCCSFPRCKPSCKCDVLGRCREPCTCCLGISCIGCHAPCTSLLTASCDFLSVKCVCGLPFCGSAVPCMLNVLGWNLIYKCTRVLACFRSMDTIKEKYSRKTGEAKV